MSNIGPFREDGPAETPRKLDISGRMILNVMMRTPFIAANWKMYKTIPDAVDFVQRFVPLVKGTEGVDKVIAPPFTALSAVAGALRGTDVMVSSQNMFYEEKGAYTGEISASMLKDAGCAFAIIGHSERRQYFGETDETVRRKLGAALKAGLGAIACIGESLDERKSGRTFDVLESQIAGGMKGFLAEDFKDIVIAYEPVWAIGTGLTATPEQAEEAHAFIRSCVERLFGEEVAHGVRILYGGSVKPDNIASLMDCPNVDGALVGGASLEAEGFSKIILNSMRG